MGRHSGAGFHFEFSIISTGTIGSLPLGGCVIKMMMYFYLALIGEVMIGMEVMGVDLICLELAYGREKVDS